MGHGGGRDEAFISGYRFKQKRIIFKLVIGGEV